MTTIVVMTVGVGATVTTAVRVGTGVTVAVRVDAGVLVGIAVRVDVGVAVGVGVRQTKAEQFALQHAPSAAAPLSHTSPRWRIPSPHTGQLE